jgi:hypothetical protein
MGHLLGHGGRRVWHLFTLAWAIPMGVTLKWLYDLEPGKGPQGGEAIVLLLLVAVAGLAFCTVVNALRLWATGAAVSRIGWLRRLLVVLAGVLAALVAFWLLLDKATSMVTADGFDPVGWAGVVLLLAGMLAFNGWALVRSCAHADGAA